MPRRPRTAEDDASFKGLGLAVAVIRKQRGLSVEDLADQIEDDLSIVERVEQGTVNVDWATLRTIAAALTTPLPALIEQAEALAPGPGGEEWRNQAGDTSPTD